MIKQAFTYLLAISMSLFLMSSCDFETVDEEKERSIKLVYTDWSESVALNHLSTYLLEEKLGYNVITKLTNVESAYAELAERKADVFTDAWLPKTQEKYYTRYAENLEKVSIIYPEARTGFVVPDYSPLKTIKDLRSHTQPIVGIDSGAGVMHKARLALESYNLQTPLESLSEKAMVSKLEDALKRRKEIVVTGWEPHWIFARYEVRFLEDPDNLFGEKEKIYAISRKDLASKHPVAVRFFERMQLSEKQLNTLVYEIRVAEDPIQGVKKWIKHNEYVVNQWVKDLKPVRKKIM
ncbi:MAG TPA: glycine betaine ABC transporter substrate-binding protein [Salinivirga sp.]|uniref:glycine betaine ABC transporter substrate-binding protein n=1 Tax=Salinivirga sp. TaxID=1970192 RepID=UPI002B493784|nr:glycine betaine ABC transporter substrate-binding protein [Salinivirga sp.]HKK58503.1 glycine betaine ABC transporter substrate-binding protein [Salinivirga sp.]